MLLFFIISSFFQKDIQQPSLSIFRSVFLVCRDNRSQTIIGNELHLTVIGYINSKMQEAKGDIQL